MLLVLDGKCWKFYDRAAFQGGLMSAQAHARPIRRLRGVRERIAPFFNRAQKFVDEMRM